MGQGEIKRSGEIVEKMLGFTLKFLEQLGSLLCHLMRVVTPKQEHVWDRESQGSNISVLDLSWLR